MGVSETVVGLVECLERVRRPTTPMDRLACRLLKLLPLYRDARKLDSWERAFLAVSEGAEHTDARRAIDSIFEFARHNLYAGFEPTSTRAEFEKLKTQLRGLGVRDCHDAGLEDW